jgi:hypothetical protein
MLLALILNKQFTKRWPDVARSGDERSLPAPWTVKELEACFVVRDQHGQQLAYVYFEDEPGRRSAAANIASGAKLCSKKTRPAQLAQAPSHQNPHPRAKRPVK